MVNKKGDCGKTPRVGKKGDKKPVRGKGLKGRIGNFFKKKWGEKKMGEEKTVKQAETIEEAIKTIWT